LINILQIIWIKIVAFIPMVIWVYIFSYLDNSLLNARRFLAGMVAGGLSVVPVLYLEDILKILWLQNWSIFSMIEHFSGNTSSVIIALVILLLVVAIFSYLMLWVLFFEKILYATKTYAKNILILSLFILVFIAFRSFTGSIDWFSHSIKNGINFGNYAFATIQGIILYYSIVGLLEESSKHYSFLWSSLVDVDTIKKWALLSTFIALGFGFVENILYLANILSNKGIGSDLITTWLFRSLFSVFVHIFCGMIVAVAFSWSYLRLNDKIVSYVKKFFFGFLLSIVIHAIYDVTLTLGFTVVIFVYFVVGYMYCTRVFHMETREI